MAGYKYQSIVLHIIRNEYYDGEEHEHKHNTAQVMLFGGVFPLLPLGLLIAQVFVFGREGGEEEVGASGCFQDDEWVAIFGDSMRKQTGSRGR